jgi:uncharacterized protein YqjF (DUF2071 family)
MGNKPFQENQRSISRQWIMTQVLQDIFFMHWQVKPITISSLIPNGLELDLYNGTAWISIVPFRVVHMRLRGCPPIPGLHTYLELNVRTYVSKNGIPGIYFLNVQTNNLPITLGARVITGIPFTRTKMKYRKRKEDYIFSSEGNFHTSFHIEMEKEIIKKGSLPFWLMERYSMYTVKGKQLYRGDIQHQPWDVWQAKGIVEQNTLLPVEAGQHYLTYYAGQKKMLIYPLVRIS